MQPTKEQLKIFVDTFLKLNRFECDHRARCGWGCYLESDMLPIAEVTLVLAWLNSQMELRSLDTTDI
jgi:hypothetical protein